MMRSVATSYITSGYLPIPIPLKTKAPRLPEWPALRITADTVGQHFGSEESNIGVLLGADDDPVADIDCDCPEAITAAAHLLPKSPAIFGRASAPKSHYLYRIDDTAETKRFTDPMTAATDAATIVELRCAKKDGTVGMQTVVPPSIHPSGEPVCWEGTNELPIEIPQPAAVRAADLQTAVSRVAAAALLARYWPKAGNGRHNAMLALAGVLARDNWQENEALAFCNALYRSIDIPDASKVDRVQTEVHSTFARRAQGESVTALSTLKGLMEERAIMKALEWLRGESEAELGTTGDNRPQIQMKNRGLEEKSTECIEVLKAANVPPTLFFRGGTLVCLHPTAEDAFLIKEVTEPILSSILAQNAIFLKGHDKTDPSERVTRNVLVTLSECEAFPPLEGIVTTPVIRANGTVLMTPGYDRQSKLYYAPSRTLSVPSIPDKPTSTDVAMALDVVKDVISDFPFEDEASKANAIAAILTPILRPAILGPTPLALFDATSAGTGKTLLAQVVSIIATGTEGAMMTVPKNRDEWRKKITSVLRACSPVVVLDNVSSKLDADELMSVLTLEEWTDRLLGSSQQVILPNRASWIATANNITLEGQMVRRSYWVRMDAKMARPFTRSDFKHNNLKLYVKQERGRILAAILTLARAWITNGMTAPSMKPLGSFESWTTVIGGVLENAGVSGFLGNGDLLYAHSDDETQLWESLLGELAAIFKDKAFTTAEILKQMTSPMNDDLKDIVETIFGEVVGQEKTLKQRLPKAFKERIGRHFGDDGGSQYWLEETNKLHRLARWVVRSDQSQKVRTMPKRVPTKQPQEDAA
jgi:hypothetical protein